ncbi:ribosome recycling factor [Spiroplasma platyhelix]|uniref:Ribosome recycling factor n=1 Tax=Spiroplasma platyhelix PALS-1 TaxID=1276218 RepID=A0A846UCQ8_9MOLU|nr:ribosome recycling factor [Spiroplasma platyhelix]MBE4703925.1 Ribosome-recycling factor [Spiroplasma platyhelix PALS-1]NKE38298.1 ribosome recycling factor [Spiroplasma platyhelix PALS-1]UJB29183.1 ribosome recycling factor [Spiroplasma platyhelix PALS-1]
MEAIILEATNCMDHAIQNYEKEISKIRTGRANPNILDSIKINSYGDYQPLKSLASIKVVEARQLVIKPYDQNSTKAIAEALNNADLQIQINVENSNSIRLIFPTLTEEVRKRLVKDLAKVTEEYRVKVRNCRRDSMQKVKVQNLPEDSAKKVEQDIQKLTNKKVELINTIEQEKVADLMKI